MQPELLPNKKITDLVISEELKSTLASEGYSSLSEILEMTPSEITDIPGLSFSMIKEYRAFLKKNDLDHLQKQ